jgi:hypothetical protein
MSDSNQPYVPVGTIVPWLGLSSSMIPAGWLLCDGLPRSRTTYAALFAAVGTTYGVGDGSTTFALPGTAQAAYASGNNHLTSATPGAWTHSTSHRFTSSITVAAGLPGTTQNNNTAANHTHDMNTGSVNTNAKNPSGDGAAAMGSHYATNTNLGGPSATGITYGGTSFYDAADAHYHALIGNAQAHGDHTHTQNAPSVGAEGSHGHGVSVSQDSSQTISSGSTQPDHARIWHLIKA